MCCFVAKYCIVLRPSLVLIVVARYSIEHSICHVYFIYDYMIIIIYVIFFYYYYVLVLYHLRLHDLLQYHLPNTIFFFLFFILPNTVFAARFPNTHSVCVCVCHSFCSAISEYIHTVCVCVCVCVCRWFRSAISE